MIATVLAVALAAVLRWAGARKLRRPGSAPVAALAVAEIAPQSEIAAVELPFAAMAINRPRRAREILERVDPERGPARDNNSGYWDAYAHALHMTGDYERQLAVARMLRRRDPGERAALSYETRALAALGRTVELERVLEQMLAFPVDPVWGAPGLRYSIVASDELRAHGHAAAADSVLSRAVRVYARVPDDVRAIPKQRFEMARALYRLGRLDEAKAMFEALVAANALAPLGDYAIEARAHLGFIAARVGDTATAAAVDRWLLDQRDPYLLGQNTELRAAVQALLGQREEAVRLLHQAMAEGRFFDVGKHTYFEYQGLRGYRPFEEWLAPKG
jgi:tetratricopeptide (TPR) repeat protein